MTTHSILHYVQLKEAWTNTTMRVKDGKKEYFVNGEWIDGEVWERENPYPELKKWNEKGATIGNLID